MEQRDQNEVHNEKKNEKMDRLPKLFLNWSGVKTDGSTAREAQLQNCIQYTRCTLNLVERLTDPHVSLERVRKSQATYSNRDRRKILYNQLSRRRRSSRIKNDKWSKDQLVHLLSDKQKRIIDSNLVKVNGTTQRESRCQNVMYGFHNVFNLMETLARREQSEYPNTDRHKTSKPDISKQRQLFKEHRRQMGETTFQNGYKRIQTAVNKNQGARNILTKYEADLAKFLKMDEVEDVDNADDGGEQSNTRMKRRRVKLSSKLQTSQSTMKPRKKARMVDVSELTRITSVHYYYYKFFIYPTWGRFAKRTYHILSREEKEAIREKFERYIESLSKEKIKQLRVRILEEKQKES